MSDAREAGVAARHNAGTRHASGEHSAGVCILRNNQERVDRSIYVSNNLGKWWIALS
jgi:hypothetical protein